MPVYNAMQFLPDSIGSIRQAAERARSAEIIVVDNGSTDGSWEWLQRELATSARLMRLPGVTISALRNAGAQAARSATLAFIDADCVIPEGYVEAALAALSRSSASAVGSRYSLPSAPHWIERTWQSLHERRGDGPVSYINSGNLVVQAVAFHSVGGFDESLVTGEDAELGQRLTRAGHLVFEARDVMAIHLGNPKSLGHFFRKQKWHALGMFGTVNAHSLDRPTMMTLAQVAALAGAWYLMVGSQASWGLRMTGALVIVFVPAALTVAYRIGQGGRVGNPVASLLLYFLYYLARIAALFTLAGGWIHRALHVPERNVTGRS